jgi:molecular chaperone DnaK
LPLHEEAIASENTDSIESATKSLNDVLTPLTQKLYTQEGDTEQQNSEASEESSENTVDAEYEEVKDEEDK